MIRTDTLRLLCGVAAGALLGCCWLLGDGLLGPSASFVLVLLVAGQDRSLGRLFTALGYYAAGSVPVVAAVIGYWGIAYTALGLAAWLGSSLLLSAPWITAARWPWALGALALTAIPPLGVIGWLSPLNAAGVLFPGLGWIGLGLLCLGCGSLYFRAGRLRIAMLTVIGIIAIASNLAYVEPATPTGWTGVDTSLAPSHGDPISAIRNNQGAINAGITQGDGARVVVFPEAILDDWRSGTRQQFAMAVPSHQIWILGADTGSADAVVLVGDGLAHAEPVARSAGLILAGNWLPWAEQTLQPAWWQSVFVIDGKRVWAALCVEQLQPWTWLEAMIQRPDVVLAMSNGWWARGGGATAHTIGTAGLAIERASSRAWVRLMGVQIVWAGNH
jgi:hypothetical protein